jgi:hypothetical protein
MSGGVARILYKILRSTIAAAVSPVFDLAQISNRREADKLFPDGYVPTGGRTFSGEDHFDTAQERLAVGHCLANLRKLCPGIQPGNNKLRACMREHIRDVSFPCLVTLAKFAEVRRSLKEECSAHLRQQCASVERGGGKFGACLRSAVASLSCTCKEALARAVRRARS